MKTFTYIFGITVFLFMTMLVINSVRHEDDVVKGVIIDKMVASPHYTQNTEFWLVIRTGNGVRHLANIDMYYKYKVGDSITVKEVYLK